MKAAFGVLWREHSGESTSARLRVEPARIVLTRNDGNTSERGVALDEIVGVETRAGEDGRSTVALELRGGDRIELESNVERHILTQLLERLFVNGLGATQRILVAARLKPGAHKAARALLRDGPPFPPEATPLVLHDVYLLDDEVLFLFGSEDGAATEALVAPEFWAAGGAWRDVIAGEVRLAERAYSWSRSEPRPGESHFGLGF